MSSEDAVCCVPSAFGEPTCRPASEEKCRLLGGQLYTRNPYACPESSNAGLHRQLPDVHLPSRQLSEMPLPSWTDVIYPFLGAPVLSFVLVAILWFFLGRLYKEFIKHSSFNQFIITYIGQNSHPVPTKPSFLMLLDTGQIICSLTAAGIFIFNSFQLSLLPEVRWMDVNIGLFSMLHHFIFGLRREFRLNKLLGLENFVDIFTVPGMLFRLFDFDPSQARWISLNFLRTLQAVIAFTRFEELGDVTFGLSEAGRQILLMALKFLTMVTCFASSVLVLEILGEVPLGKIGIVTTGMGDISFYRMFYWIVETISTVGYGDFTPQTMPSQLVTMLCMVSGVGFFTIELNKLIEIISRDRAGSGSYQKTSHRHLVLVGGGVRNVDETFLSSLLEELYHESYSNDWPDLVVMTSKEESIEALKKLIRTTLDRQAHHRCTLLVGSPLKLKDLIRSRCDVAALVCIIADTTGGCDAVTEDKANILRALSLKARFPKVPYRLMLLLRESQEQALSAGVEIPRVFSLNEMKNNTFWQTCRCKGWNTLLHNLLITCDADASGNSSEWFYNYVNGADNEIYGFLAAPEFHGLSFQDFVHEVYARSGACVFAGQVDGKILSAPLHQIESVGADTVFFAIATDDEVLENIAIDPKQCNWRDILLKKRFEMFMKADAEFFHSSDATTNNGYALLQPEPIQTSLTITREPTRQVPYFGEPGDEAMYSGRSNLPQTPKTPTGKMAQQAVSIAEEGGKLDKYQIEDLEIRARNIIVNAASDGFVLVLNLTREWRSMIPLISRSRAGYEPFRTPLVILGLEPPPKSLHAFLEFEEDTKLGYICGSPIVTEDLVKAGVKNCNTIACPGPLEGAGGELTAMLDADVVIVNRSLEHLGIRQAQILEFKRTENICLLPRLLPEDATLSSPSKDESSRHSSKERSSSQSLLPSFEVDISESTQLNTPRNLELSSTYSLTPRNQQFCDNRVVSGIEKALEACFSWVSRAVNSAGDTSGIKDPPYSHDPRFASGHIICSTRALGSLLGRAFYTPGTLEVVQSLVNPDEDDEAAVFPWQISPKVGYVGMKYGDVLHSLVHEPTHPALPIGIFREGGTEHDDMGFVWTNPTYDVVILKTDLLYVLGDRNFGRHAYEEGILYGSGDRYNGGAKQKSKNVRRRHTFADQRAQAEFAAPKVEKAKTGKI